jgi:Sec7-like guanine-nucleotide exchange factor
MLNIAVLSAFLERMQMEGMLKDDNLGAFLISFYIPGEGQKISRIL